MRRNSCHVSVEVLVGYLQANSRGTLQLNLGCDQAFQDLLLEDVLGRKLHALLNGARPDQFKLFFELALEHDTFFDDRRDAVQELARRRELFSNAGRRGCQRHEGT